LALFKALRGYFARREDPYAGGDLENAQRIGFLLFGLQSLLMALLWPLSPPTKHLGALGWVLAAALVGLGFASSYQMRRRRLPSWTTLLWLSYGAVAALGLLQWLGGGVGAPYERAVFLPVFFVAAIQPPRKIAGFVGFTSLVLLAPLIYEGWDAQAAGAYAATIVILAGLSLGVNVPMSAIRAQRLAHARDEALAREEARIDSLTGLHNRRAFDEALHEEIKLAGRLEMPLAVAMVDIVDFKRINDEWSPAEGDRCLCEVAEAIRATLRDPDHCFRWGGDEFALILTATGAAGATSLADRLAEAVASSCHRPDDQPIRIRFATAEFREGMSSSELTEMAGLALTAAKLNAAR
jgi:diguanylate cyclase (GGDEF)-like protein